MDRFKDLPREPTLIDELGRLTLPKKFRIALGLPEGQKYPIWIEAYPDLEKPTCLILKK